MSDLTRAHPFPNTRWSIVARSGDTDEATRQKALADLCELYWPPVYAFVRSTGNSPHDSEDITQGFFAQLLAREDFAHADASKGKLRTFLLTSVKNFMANEWRRASRQKRGSGKAVLSLDLDAAETHFHVPEPREETTPEKLYERQWVLTLLTHVLKNLGKRYDADGKSLLFGSVQPALTPGAPMRPYAEIAAQLDMSEPALKVAVHRLRRRYGAMLKEAIADTLDPDEDLEVELSHLMTVFS